MAQAQDRSCEKRQSTRCGGPSAQGLPLATSGRLPHRDGKSKRKGSLLGLAGLSGSCTCGGGARHLAVVGKERSASSASYPAPLCRAYARLLMDHFERVGLWSTTSAGRWCWRRSSACKGSGRPRGPGARRTIDSLRHVHTWVLQGLYCHWLSSMPPSEQLSGRAKRKHRLPVPHRDGKSKRQGSLLGLAGLSGSCTCGGGARHLAVVGKERSASSASYPAPLCRAYARLLMDHFERVGLWSTTSAGRWCWRRSSACKGSGRPRRPRGPGARRTIDSLRHVHTWVLQGLYCHWLSSMPPSEQLSGRAKRKHRLPVPHRDGKSKRSAGSIDPIQFTKARPYLGPSRALLPLVWAPSSEVQSPKGGYSADPQVQSRLLTALTAISRPLPVIPDFEPEHARFSTAVVVCQQQRAKISGLLRTMTENPSAERQ